mgnify:CR=1 FL=1
MEDKDENIKQETSSTHELEVAAENVEIEDSAIAETGLALPNKRRIPWIWLGVLFLILMLALGVFLGYRQGIARRLARSETTVVELAAEQYQLAFQDMAAGNYQNAKSRIEYVIRIYPQFPGAPDLLRDILLDLLEQLRPSLLTAQACDALEFLLVAGLGLLEFTRRKFALRWNRVQEEIQELIERREAEAA